MQQAVFYRACLLAVLWALFWSFCEKVAAQSGTNERGGGDLVSLAFPTDNDAVLNGRPEYFYMGLDRLIAGRREWSWEGGTYGYNRNARATPAGWRFTRFHEGVDIAPIYRDGNGEPLDEVRTVDNGRVVYVNRSASRSDYGRYVVVEHLWEGSAFLTLYAHLAETTVRVGEHVRRGQQLGVLGYSGNGLDRDRAHLHFEINLMLNEHYDLWQEERRPRWSSRHGRYHGFNLAGVSPIELITYNLRRPRASILAMLSSERADVTAFVPAGPPPNLLERHPWLCRSCNGDPPPDWAWSWEVGFTRAGRPVSIEPSDLHIASIELGRIDAQVRADYLHSRILTRRGPGSALNSTARLLLSVIFTRPDQVPNW